LEEFKKFSIPVKWRKYIWLGIIGTLIYALKWLASRNTDLEKDLKNCNESKVELMENRRKADSIMMILFIKEALRKADENIIQPKIDSIKSDKI
jgi:hypothetical protein